MALVSPQVVCPNCRSGSIRKNGTVVHSAGRVQKYRCKTCQSNFQDGTIITKEFAYCL